MPKPSENEGKDAFIPRCIEMLAKEKPDMANDQRIAICHSIWEESKSVEDASVADVNLPLPSDLGLTPAGYLDAKCKGWSPEARAASAAARKSGKVEQDKNLLQPAPTPAQKELYIKVKSIKDKGTFSALMNRKIGIAEGKARAWSKRAAAFESGSKEQRRAVHISLGYGTAATKYALTRERFSVGE